MPRSRSTRDISSACRWETVEHSIASVPAFMDAAAPSSLITLVLTILGGGAIFLIPAFILLYRVFGKRVW